MASLLTELVKKCLEKLIDEAIAEARHVFCFTYIVKEFEEERARLEAERITLGERVKVAKGRNKVIQANVGFWKEEVDKLIEEDTETKQKCFFGFCPDYIWRYRRGKTLTNKMKDIKRLMEKGERFENIELPHSLSNVERYSSRYYISLKSRESKYKELLDALKDDNNYIIGLQGMGGIGKTTLAKEVGKELKQSKQFAYVIDTTVSFSPNIKKIQDDLVGSLGLELEECNESIRQKNLWSILTNGQKILLIMDDVWDRRPMLDFDAIGIPNRDNHKGCRVLVTSRDKQILNKLDCDKIIELDLLSEEDAWIMFKSSAGINNSSSKNVINKGREIAKECKQLPVAILVVASCLKGQQSQVHEWNVTLKSLRSPVYMHGIDDDMVDIYKCLKLSYDFMTDEKAKGLFLLCSLFREDEEISIEVLTRLFIGAGLLGDDYGSYHNARNRAAVAKYRLLDTCLLFEAGEKHVKMHDFIRDMAQWIAIKEILSLKYLSFEEKDMDLFSYKFDGSKLEILIVNMDRDEDRKCMDVPKNFFENIVKLRVLYFLGKNKRSLSLPISIQSLRNVRSMLVHMVDLGDISVLGNLQSLETLDLVQCIINELPREITKLEKFKLLKLECCEIRMNNPFEVIERCSSLEELYFIDSFNGFCRDINFPELQRYHIRKGWAVMNDLLSKYVVFPSNDDAYCFSKATLNNCMHTAEVLRLNGVKWEWRNIMPETVPINLGMDDLVELRLRCISQLQCLIDVIGSQVPNVLPKLVVLKLSRMENLEKLFNGTPSFHSLKNLEKLSIKDCKHLQGLFKCKLNLCNLKTIKLWDCPMLVSLYQLLTSRNLVLLETLKIGYCKRLENIIADERRKEESREEIEDSDSNTKCNGSMFPKLKVLDIEGCPLLESIFPFLFVHDLPVLQTIKISRCDGLKYIFGQYQHVEFSSLRQLELCGLPNFIDMFSKSNHPISWSAKGSSSISSHDSKAQIQLNSIKSNIFSVDLASESNSYCLNIWERAQCLQIPSKIICNIKKIELSHFSKIKSVFILSIAPRMLLETLTVRNCDELKNIIDIGDYDNGSNNWGNVFPKMKEVYIEGCPQMEYIFGHCANNRQNHVEIQLHLPELKCLNLCNLSSLVAMCPKQYRTTVPPLAKLELNKCSQVAIKSFSDFIIHSVSESLDSTIIKDDGDLQKAIPFPPIAIKKSVTTQGFDGENWLKTSKTNDHQGSLNDNTVMKGSSNIEEQFLMDDKIMLSKSRLSSIASQFPPSKGFPYGIEVQATSGHELTSSNENSIESNKFEIVKTDMNQITEGKQEFVVNIPDLETPSVANSPTNSEELLNEQSKSQQCLMDQQHLLGEIDTTVKPSQELLNEKLTGQQHLLGESHTTVKPSLGNNCFKEIKVQDIHEGSSSGKTSATLSAISETRNVPPIQLVAPKQKGIKLSFEDVTTLANAKTITSPTHSEPNVSSSWPLFNYEHKTSSHEYCDGQIVVPSFSISTTEEPLTIEDLDIIDYLEITRTNNDQVPLNDHAFKKVSSNIEVKIPIDDELRPSKSEHSPRNTIPIASQFPLVPSTGDPSHIVEDSSSLFVTRELEQLISKKHLNYEHLSLLTDFLVKHPSVLLKDNSLSNRYKGYAYNCLAELLKFLQTHSGLDVLGSSHCEFVELVQDMRKFSFDKDWLNGVERCALFPDLQFSQVALQKLLDSKKQVTKDVEEMRLKINICTQQVEEDLKHQLTSTEAVLETMVQQDAKIIETKAALSAPLGY